MFENHPLLVYLDDTLVVDDLAALGQKVDGFLLRGVKNVYDYSVRTGQPTLNTDAWRQRSDAVRLDAQYYPRYDFIRANFPGKPIYMVIEGNPALDRHTYEPNDPALLGQFAQVREVVQSARYLPDAFIVKITDYQWWEGGRLVTCTETNFDTCYNFFLPVLYEKYKKETEIWIGAASIKINRPAFSTAIDRWNNPTTGGPHFPVGFSYYHTSVGNGRTLADPRVMLSELQDPTEPLAVADSHPYARWNGKPLKEVHLSIGAFSNFQNPGSQHYGLWGFDQHNYFPGVKLALTGVDKAIEVFTHGLPTPEWKDYIGFFDPTPPPPDTTAPPRPAYLTAEMDGDGIGVLLEWVHPGGEAWTEVDIYKDGHYYDSVPAGYTTFLDDVVIVGQTYTYRVEGVDAAGNKSGPTDPVSITIPAGEDTPPTAPTGLTGELFSVDGKPAVSLRWDKSEDDLGVDGYRVEREAEGITIRLGEVAKTSYFDVGVDQGTAYTYAVRAFDGKGQESPLSNVFTIYVPYDPVDPTLGELGEQIKAFRESLEQASAEIIKELQNVTQALQQIANNGRIRIPPFPRFGEISEADAQNHERAESDGGDG